MLWAVFCRVAEVFTVQADILLLHSMPEKRLVSTQHRVQTCAAKVSVCFYSLENISTFFPDSIRIKSGKQPIIVDAVTLFLFIEV